MTDAAQPSPSTRRIETVDALPSGTARDVLTLLGEAAASDGQWAVSEQGRLNLRGGARPGVHHLLVHVGDELVGYGQLEDADPVEPPAAEFLISTTRRAHGHGRALGRALLAASGRRLRVWAHGGHPAARHLALQLGLS